jgi:hypothetical protein
MEKTNNDFNEIYKGITRIVKAKEKDETVWFAVIGNTIISRGTFKTRQQVKEDLEKIDYEQMCKIALAVTTALKNYQPEKVKKV